MVCTNFYTHSNVIHSQLSITHTIIMNMFREKMMCICWWWKRYKPDEEDDDGVK